MEIKQLAKLGFIFANLILFLNIEQAVAETEGLYTNALWDDACNQCWPYPHTEKNNHCKPSDCAIQGYYHCKPQDPPLAVDDDPRLIELIKSGECSYAPFVSLNEGEAEYVKSIEICTNVLDKMAGRFSFPANPDEAEKLKMDFYLTRFKASILRNSYAQMKLAMDYDIGRGTQQNRKKATELYNEAAIEGIPFAQYALGARYAYGISMPKDKEKAIMWLNKAMNNHPTSTADKKAQNLLTSCAMKLIERLTPS